MPINESNAAAIIEAVERNQKTEIIPLKEGVCVLATSSATGVTLNNVKPFIDQYLQRPERLKGCSTHQSLSSLLQHIVVFQKVDSAVFADALSGTLRVIYDYHSAELTSFNEHKAVFTAKKSRQWERWISRNGNSFNQSEFAEFIEENALDLIDPPARTLENVNDAALLDIAKTLNFSIASASKVIELARGISINEASKAKSHFSPSSGEMTLEYVSEHVNASGKKLNVPGLFLIAIPVFEGEHPYRIVVRLRYRLKDGVVSWMFQLYQPEKCLEDAFNEICNQTAEISGLPVYRGTPES